MLRKTRLTPYRAAMIRLTAIISFLVILSAVTMMPANAEPSHGIAMHGPPSLPANYLHFPYANPDAPQGGEITYGVLGTFDSLNPFILKSQGTTARGMWDQQFGNLVYEPLMARSRDEPFTMYGLIAEKIETPDDRSWAEFTLNPKAKWSDGKPITVEDVLFTYELLEEKGRPPYSSRMDKIAKIEKTGPNKVRFIFNEKSDREFPLIIALSPVLPKHAIDRDTFDQSTLIPPVGSGPYRIAKVDAGKLIIFEKDPNYWARDLPSKRGFDNFGSIRIEYYRNFNSMFEAFKKGLFDVLPVGDPTLWRRGFDFPAVTDGRVVKEAFKSGKPSNLLGFVFNTRKPMFDNREVRRALAMMFDFEWVNKNIFLSAYQRTTSFWHGSYLASAGNVASPLELALFGEAANDIDPAVLDGTYRPPVSNGSGRDRKIMRKAFNILKKQGYRSEGGKLVNASGEPLAFEIMTRDQNEERLAIAFQRSLALIGVDVTIRTVDDAQYQRRVQTHDYDMMLRTHSASLSPGIEQIGRWGSATKDLKGSYNYAGVAETVIDRAIQAMLDAREKDEFTAAVRALDRLLISGHYVVPLFHLDEQWVARREHLGRPDKTSLYGPQFSTWWDNRAGN